MDDKDLLDQLYEAMVAAKQHNKTQFVFRESSGDHWWHSGFLPVEAMDFFVLYPSGEFDKSSEAPALDPKAWADYVMGKEHNVGSIEVDGDVKIPLVADAPKAAPRSPRGDMFKFLLGFCAFAPFAMIAMSFALHAVSPSIDPWQMALIPLALCIPFSLFLLVRSLNHRDPRQGWTSSTLLSNAHVVIYGLAYFMAHEADLPPQVAINHNIIAVVIMACLVGSGAGLLVVWDSKEAK